MRAPSTLSFSGATRGATAIVASRNCPGGICIGWRATGCELTIASLGTQVTAPGTRWLTYVIFVTFTFVTFVLL